MELMNVSVYSCGDTSLGCSCGDCPASPVCSASGPPPSHESDSCSIKIGLLQVRLVMIMICSFIRLHSFVGYELDLDALSA